METWTEELSKLATAELHQRLVTAHFGPDGLEYWTEALSAFAFRDDVTFDDLVGLYKEGLSHEQREEINELLWQKENNPFVTAFKRMPLVQQLDSLERILSSTVSVGSGGYEVIFLLGYINTPHECLRKSLEMAEGIDAAQDIEFKDARCFLDVARLIHPREVSSAVSRETGPQ